MLTLLLTVTAQGVQSPVLEKIGLRGLKRMKAGQEDLTQNPEYLAAQAQQQEMVVITQPPVYSKLRVYDQRVDDQSPVHVKKIEIFGRDDCTWCTKAKSLVKDKKLPYEFFDMAFENNQNLTKNYLSALDVTYDTIPQIFMIDNHNTRWFIGGFTNLDVFVRKHLKPHG